MQEEVENRTINLAISTTKLTSSSIISGIRKYLQYKDNYSRKIIKKQSVKKLLKQDQGASNVEIDKSGIKDFERLARKYGVTFAVRKDKSVSPARYFVFVRSKDSDALDAICKEYEARILTKGKRPSILKQLNKFKELASLMPAKVRQKSQERGR